MSSRGNIFTLATVPQARPAVHPVLPEVYPVRTSIQKNPDLLAYMILALVVVGLAILISYLNLEWILSVGFAPLYFFWILVFVNGIVLAYTAFVITSIVTGGSDAVPNKCFALLFWTFVGIQVLLLVWTLAFFSSRTDRSLPLALAFLYIFVVAFYYWLGSQVLDTVGRLLLLVPLTFAFLLFGYSWWYRFPIPSSGGPPS